MATAALRRRSAPRALDPLLDATAAVVKRRLIEVVRGTQWRHHRGEAGLDLIAIAPFGQKAGFEKVIKLIDATQIDTTEDNVQESETHQGRRVFAAVDDSTSLELAHGSNRVRRMMP